MPANVLVLTIGHMWPFPYSGSLLCFVSPSNGPRHCTAPRCFEGLLGGSSVRGESGQADHGDREAPNEKTCDDCQDVFFSKKKEKTWPRGMI